MGQINAQQDSETTDKEYRKFVWSRYIAGILIAVILLWGSGYLIKKIMPDGGGNDTASQRHAPEESHQQTEIADSANAPETPVTGHPPEATGTLIPPASAPSHGGTDLAVAPGPPGTALVESVIAPLEYELEKRFWGWRPNDYLNVTDNVNELQVGVLEVTRRATVVLTDRLSRRGSAEAIDPNLERAMNSLMIKAESYMFPAPENKYKEAISELRIYQEKLRKGNASFYTRTDNLIPLLRSFEELLGSCDDNLIKQYEESGKKVSTFRADNYFFYSKGVAKAMYSILKAVEHDFQKTVEGRGATDILHHAIEACHHAAELEPWLFVTDANLNGIFANHRANMAAPISHARFYVDILIETLST